MTAVLIENMMNEALLEGVFPGAVLLSASGGSIQFHQAFGRTKNHSGQVVTDQVFFDLASLTKPLATTLAIMKLIQWRRLQLSDRLGHLLPVFEKTDKAGIEVRHLLTHTSGLPAYRPYYEILAGVPFTERGKHLRQLLVQEPLTASPMVHTCYSDIGFMILAWIIEHLSGKRLDTFVTEEIYGPLGIGQLFFPGVSEAGEPRAEAAHFTYAATEVCPWRMRLIEGVVHDDNAYVMGGVAGHAGLFGTSAGVYQLLKVLLSVYTGKGESAIFDRRLIRLFLTPQEGTGRALGFDLPSKSHSSSGTYFSESSVGHLGFTGTSFWIDLERETIVILLTNRVHPTRKNEKIKAFRPKIHDAVMETILSGKKNF